MDKRDFTYVADPADPEGWISDPFHDLNVPVPLGDITDFPVQCVSISKAWVPLIVSSLERLKYGDMYDANALEMEHVLNNINTLQNILAIGNCDGGENDYTCLNVPLYSPIIDWLPANPFDPNAPIPFGYSVRPWFISDEDFPITGIKKGDVIISIIGSLVAFPPIVPASGVPRMQLRVQGPAEVDIEFAKVFQGGVAVVFVDGIPNHWVDLQSYALSDILNVVSWFELFGLAVENFTGGVTEDAISCPENREYVIEAQFFPRPAVDFTLGYGGGVRKITICSSEEQIDLTGFVRDVRIQNGRLEKQIDLDWLDVDAIDQDDIQDGPDLRGNGCALEYFDLATMTWQKITGTDYLNVLDTCRIKDNVEIEVETGNQLRLFHISSGTFQDVSVNASGSVFASSKTFSLRSYNHTHNMLLGLTGRFNFRSNLSGGANDALVNIWSNEAETMLSLRAASASVPNYIQTRDEANRIMHEFARNGWFSAIQQLIVNDFTSTGAKRGQGRLLGEWVDSTDATRRGRMIMQVDGYSGIAEALRAEWFDNVSTLGFFGRPAIPRPTIDADTVEDVLSQLLDSFDGLGLVENLSGYDAENPIPGGAVTVLPQFEIYYDFEGLAHTQKFNATWGNWFDTAGYVNETDSTFEAVQLRSAMSLGQTVIRVKVVVNVITLPSGNINLYTSIWDGFALTTVCTVASAATGMVVFECPVGFKGEGDFLDLRVAGDSGVACSFQVKSVNIIGAGFSQIDEMKLADDFIQTDDYSNVFVLPT